MTHNSDAQSWYNAYWQYRTTVMVNNSGGELNDFQVQLVLDSEFPWSHVTEDGRDIRFTASDGQTELPYWIEQWNHGSGASVWVRVNSIAASPSATTLYLYYGNETATAASNGFGTFDFFDDFSSGMLEPGRWSSSGGTWSVITATQSNGIPAMWPGVSSVQPVSICSCRPSQVRIMWLRCQVCYLQEGHGAGHPRNHKSIIIYT